MVEPLKPQAKLLANKNVSQAELAEFEQLLSARFDKDPSLPDEQRANRQRRLEELAAKIKGKPLER
ncbi:hypothetical protein [Reyranella soli]|jgi:hypothetical protein|uniref:Uncharacterized protein n=1 Tax=Reyranella soli TaxID=1230389 RepID=A0A512NJN3_9HYPH|nr:hypothetical protein [Reyranella soli]GEP59161.1 hypothetical protein RSO01_63270 [Reyranella soli]